LQQRESQ